MTPQVDLGRVFDASPNAYMVLDAELRFVAANAAYLRATSKTLDQLLGQRVFDVFPDDPSDPNNPSRTLLRRSLQKVLETGEPDELAFIPYRVPTPDDPDALRYWSASHAPLRDADGRVRHVLQHTVDVTALHALKETGDSRPRDRAGVLARAQAVQAENERMEAESESLRELFDQAPGFMCVLEGPEHVFKIANDAYLRLVGKRAIVGKPVRDALPEVVEQGFIDILDRVASSGEAFRGDGVAVTLQRQAGGPAEERFVDFVYQPVASSDGRTRWIFVQGHDVTERKLAEREMAAARQAAEAFSTELVEQSRQVAAALERATRRIAELEAQLAER